jgi:copper resistance protein B
LALAIGALTAIPVWAQAESEADEHAGHRQMSPDASRKDSKGDGESRDAMPAMPHDTTAGNDPSGGAMDHGEMNMQGGSAPPDARDPHAYAAGNTLGGGNSSQASLGRLRLADEHDFGTVLLDRLERVYTSDDYSTAYDAQASVGRDYERLVFKAEGDYARGRVQEARTELLWGHAVAAYWDTQLGLRYDSGEGPDRNWLAFGVQGIAPYWFELDLSAYVGSDGRTALRLEAEYELLLTQRLVLQPRAEFNVYGRSDEERGIGSGLSDATAGLRLRYEITRQFAPYVGIEWAGSFGETEDFARAAGERSNETRWIAGVRFWF